MAKALASALEQKDAPGIREVLQPTPERVAVPEALAQHRVEGARIADYSGLLGREAL